jgi:glucan phosphoethanolaminetransferase (alkaline phosphatase superfamily)
MLGIVLALTIAFSFHLAYVNPILFDNHFTGTSLGSFFQTSTEYLLLEPLAPPIHRDQVHQPFGANAPKPDNNVVIVFDESMRADHLSLNGYERERHPFLRA